MTVTELNDGVGPVIAATLFDLAPLGYSQTEYMLDGTAAAYRRRRDGLEAVEHADYATRLLVFGPTDAARFNGTVWVEWLNVSGGLDAAPDWTFTHTELMRRGAAWVGVSAQRIGVAGGDSVFGDMSSPGLVGTSPERYAGLHHPGDRFSYDMFTQAGEAVRASLGTILDRLPVERVLAIGESQSAFRLTTYVNEVDPLAQVFDGFFVHARGGPGAPLDDESPAISFEDPPVPFRDDLRVPVMCVEAETDLAVLGYVSARQPDNEQFVLWEMAGTSHADAYTFYGGMVDTGALPIEELAAAWTPQCEYFGMTLDKPVNAGPQHYVLNAAVARFDQWLRDGTRPPATDRLSVRTLSDPIEFKTDEHGNALGGVRTPHVDVPVAVLSGLGNRGAPMAHLCGTTTRFTAGQLAALYPSRAEYLDRFAAATERAVSAGHLLPADAPEINALADALCPLR
jgi:hypothetical protein